MARLEIMIFCEKELTLLLHNCNGLDKCNIVQPVQIKSQIAGVIHYELADWLMKLRELSTHFRQS